MQSQGSPEQTILRMQSINLEISFPIKYGILLFGYTKAGKTTTAHYLTHQELVGGYNDQKNVKYFFKDVEWKYQHAKIGDSFCAGTRVPNLFQYEENGEKMCLVDFPGQSDSYNCFSQICKRFFIYQVFSKVESVKFILIFRYSDMQKTSELMKRTFKQFLAGFRNINEIKSQLLNSTSVIITHVPKQKSLNDVRRKFQQTPNLPGQFKQFYADLKQALLKNNRVFIFHNAELGVTCNTQNTLLKKINASTLFWKRQTNQKQELDMGHIKFQIDEQITDQGQFRYQLTELRKFYQQNIHKNRNNFVKILNIFTKDNQKMDDKLDWTKQILAISQEKYKREKESQCKDLYQLYEQKKRQKIRHLFLKINNEMRESSSVPNSEMPFWLLKLKTQKFIEDLSEQNAYRQFINNQLNALNKYQEGIKKILVSLIQLVLQKNQRDRLQESQMMIEATLDVAYEIYKYIEISNKLYRLMRTTTVKKLFRNIKYHGLEFIIIEYPTILKSFFLLAIPKSSSQILLQNLDLIKFDQKLSAKGVAEVAKFLQLFQQNLSFESLYSQNLNLNLKKTLRLKLENQIKKWNNASQLLNNISSLPIENPNKAKQKRKAQLRNYKTWKQSIGNQYILQVESSYNQKQEDQYAILLYKKVCDQAFPKGFIEYFMKNLLCS